MEAWCKIDDKYDGRIAIYTDYLLRYKKNVKTTHLFVLKETFIVTPSKSKFALN